jgi:hypothetical protein
MQEFLTLIAQWVVMLIALGGVAIGLWKFNKSVGRAEANHTHENTEVRNEISALTKIFEVRQDEVNRGFKEIKTILGNGEGHGIRGEIKLMQIKCAEQMGCLTGSINENRIRLSAQQHEIDELKEFNKER